MTMPQTIALALSTNPLAFAAWVLEKCNGWADTGGQIESRFTKDQLITNIMIYLVNDAIGSTIWLYHGAAKEEPSHNRIVVPTGFAAYPIEIIPPPPRHVAELEFNITRWTEVPSGGHFAAWEEPAAFAKEVAAFLPRTGEAANLFEPFALRRLKYLLPGTKISQYIVEYRHQDRPLFLVSQKVLSRHFQK